MERAGLFSRSTTTKNKTGIPMKKLAATIVMLAAAGGAFAINWTNGGDQQPDFSNITLFARDVTILKTGGIGGGGAIGVSPVPEPDSYAMMIGALGLITFMARRKRS